MNSDKNKKYADLGQSDKRTKEFFRKFNYGKILSNLVNKNDPLIFDVGSNVGQSVVKFKKIWPEATIHCFEPQIECWELLDKLSKDNDGVIINKFAVGRSNEEKKEFFTHDLNSGISGFNKINLRSSDSIDLNEIIDQDSKVEEYSKTINHSRHVQVKSLNSYIEEMEIKKIDFIKIDTQSFDSEVIEGIGESLDIIDLIQTEIKLFDYYEKSSSFFEVESLIQPYGFKLYDISYISKNPMNGRTDWVDALYVKS
tara:strand:+ start:2729 stop:3493 length:765 start_codon:yes stop_codon:yes gene_type:complete